MDDVIGAVTETGNVFEWKIYDFFSLISEMEDNCDAALSSPLFSCRGISWSLLIGLEDYLNFKMCSDKYINLYLFRESNGPPITTEISLALKSAKGDKMLERICTKIFEERDREECFQFIWIPELERRKDELVPSDVLTVLCTLKVPKSTGQTKRRNKILEDFRQLFFNQENCDVVLRVEGLEFKPHRAILSARSSVFATTFRNDMKKEISHVDIEDCEPSSFSDFLCFIYCEEIEDISEENAFSLFTASNKFDIPDLREKCLEFIKRNMSNMSVDTFCEILQSSLQHFDDELTLLTRKFFIENVSDIIYTDKWEELLTKNPIQCNEMFKEYVEESM